MLNEIEKIIEIFLSELINDENKEKISEEKIDKLKFFAELIIIPGFISVSFTNLREVLSLIKGDIITVEKEKK